METNNLNNILSTGNKWGDLLLGTATGLASSGDKKGMYYINANYKGNGLADTDLDYIVNYDYKNPYDMANMLSSMWGGNNKGLPSSISGRFKQGYGELKNRLGNIFRAPGSEDQGSVRQDIDREVNNYPQWYQDDPIAQAIRELNQYGKVDSVSPIHDALNTNYQP